jgi:hypothetical protein
MGKWKIVSRKELTPATDVVVDITHCTSVWGDLKTGSSGPRLWFGKGRPPASALRANPLCCLLWPSGRSAFVRAGYMLRLLRYGNVCMALWQVPVPRAHGSGELREVASARTLTRRWFIPSGNSTTPRHCGSLLLCWFRCKVFRPPNSTSEPSL